MYEIQYDIDGIDEFYRFALLTELKNGNLVIISKLIYTEHFFLVSL